MVLLVLGASVLAIDIGYRAAQAFASLGTFAVTTYGQISYPGDTFQHSIILQQNDVLTLPDSDASDGIVIHLYKTYRMTDQAANKVQEGYEEITTNTPTGTSLTYPVSLPIATSTPSGSYSAVAVLFKITQTWDRTTNTWSTGTPVVIDKSGVTFQVQTPTPAPTPSSSQILDWIASAFQSLICWVKGLFGQAC